MKKENRKKICRITAVLLCGVLLAGSVTPLQASGNPAKDENVYVNLNQDGSVDGIYVVNAYRLEQDTQIVDYGNYESVKNLSSDAEIESRKGTVTVDAEAGEFFYQGNLRSKEIPWEISISYTLDGKKISAKELAGKNGRLKILIHIGQNDKADAVFFENYLLQVTLTMDMERCSNLEAPGATVANVGTDKQLVYSILAGSEKDITVTADVLDFEMDAVSIQGLPMNLDVDRDRFSLDDLHEKAGKINDAADEFSDGAKDLAGGVDSLKEGAEGLKDGADSLKEGIESYADGARTLGDGIDTLKDGSSDLADGARELADGTGELANGIVSLLDGITRLSNGYQGENGAAAGARKLADGVKELKAGSHQLSEGVGLLVDMISGLGESSQGSLDGKAELLAEAARTQGLPVEGDTPREKLESLSAYLSNSLDSMLDGIGQMMEAVGNLGGGMPEGLPGMENESETEPETELETETETELETETTADPETETTAGEETGTETAAEPETGTEAETETAARPETGTEPETETETETTTEAETGTAVEPETTTETAAGPGAETGTAVEPETETTTETAAEPETETKAETAAGSEAEPEAKTETPAEPETETGTKPETETKTKTEAETKTEAAAGAETESGGSEETVQKLSYPVRPGKAGQVRHLAFEGRETVPQVMALSSQGEKQLPFPSVSVDDLKKLLAMKSAVDQLLGAYEAVDTLTASLGSGETLAQLAQLKEGAAALDAGIGGLESGTASLADGIGQLADGTGQLVDGSSELADGAYELADGSEEFADGTKELVDGVSDLADGMDVLNDASDALRDGSAQLADGSGELADGTKELADGVSDLKEGTDEFKSEAGDIDGQIDAEVDGVIDELSGSGFEPVSFVSDQNTNVELVQFVMKTEGIRIPEEADIPVEEEPMSFWQRLLALFGL